MRAARCLAQHDDGEGSDGGPHAHGEGEDGAGEVSAGEDHLAFGGRHLQEPLEIAHRDRLDHRGVGAVLGGFPMTRSAGHFADDCHPLLAAFAVGGLCGFEMAAKQVHEVGA